jgi:glycosyltransferase A (GT-A) superfamily protein (DUF2064 family)
MAGKVNRRRPGFGWHLLVMAKTPVAGRVKTRLSPALLPQQAAEVAAAALADTLAAVAACGATRRILALDGEPGEWIPQGFTVVAQRGSTMNERLAAAWSEAGGRGLQIGMDTPQVTAELLDHCLEVTATPGATASIGLAEDGGWWALGLSGCCEPDLFSEVEMSAATTGAAQLAALRAHGHVVQQLPVLRDIDQVEDLEAVSALAPSSRVAATWRAIQRSGAARSARLSTS